MSSGISTSQAAEFHASFQAEKGAIQRILETDTNPPLVELRRRITSLRAAVDGILSSIPLYDRGRYEKQLAELEAKISSTRATERPKTKFSFAKSISSSTTKPKAGSAPSSSSALPKPGAEVEAESTSQSSSISNAGESSTSLSTYTISNMRGKVVRPPTLPEGTTTYTLSLSALEDCVIDLRPQHATDPRHANLDDHAGGSERFGPKLTAIHGKGLKKCLLIAPIVGGSALLDEVEGCVLILGAQQFRIHSSSHATILLHVASLPVIEYSNNLTFGGYPSVLLPPHASLSENPGSEHPISESKHAQVQDFDWVRSGPSPNWRLATGDPDSPSQMITADLVDRIAGISDEDVKGILDKVTPKSSD
ncbi:hypothetical protein I316_04729 [Kwoniella heveanensis BCC8398]|uniref:C-CAP/cofactor C-like domain-containing protein n=1 Tax=Kwoniella heveanensis BCC8398 TaxID=1296120 RepID=A0A1B9GS25_9TREE|nr:hypothetical protein I316_04729 [Kwoniella heveanensis BCC8398]